MEKNDSEKNMSIYEASEFWDEHDFTEFDDVEEDTTIKFNLKKKKYVGIDDDLYVAISKKAKSLAKAEETLINEWLAEKIGNVG